MVSCLSYTPLSSTKIIANCSKFLTWFRRELVEQLNTTSLQLHQEDFTPLLLQLWFSSSLFYILRALLFSLNYYYYYYKFWDPLFSAAVCSNETNLSAYLVVVPTILLFHSGNTSLYVCWINSQLYWYRWSLGLEIYMYTYFIRNVYVLYPPELNTTSSSSIWFPGRKLQA